MEAHIPAPTLVEEVVLRLNRDALLEGYVPMTKVTPKGRRTVKLRLPDVATLLNQFFNWEIATRKVTMVSRFANAGFIAYGESSGRWRAIKEIPASNYVLVSATGSAYPVDIPRVVILASNQGASYIYWTDEPGELHPDSRLYPLMVGNISSNGWICIGSSGLRCTAVTEIDKFARGVIEAPSTGTYCERQPVDEFFAELRDKGWDTSIGRKHAITLRKLIEAPPDATY